MVAVNSHPSRADLEAFALGRLHDDSHVAVEEHLNRCSSCQLVIDQVPGDTLVALLRSAASLSDTIKALEGAPTIADTPAEAPAVTDGTTCALAPGEAVTAADLPAALIGHPRYEPTRLLGTGGMGTVWLAQHRVMGRQVAVKVIRPEFVAKPGAAERFQRETHAAARLHHPNIVTAFDAENAGASHLLAMEYVEGVTLAELLRQRGPLPVTEACDAIRQAALGLEHACACGLIHRDLKPHNLMRTADGTVKILDFGLAVLADVNRAGDGLTAENVVLGTPDYIAPEQAEDSRAADIRSDIYSLGCTLYHLLTGQVPFPGDSVLRKLDGHRQRKAKPIQTLRPEVPAELAVIVARMMAKNPADRYQRPGEVAAALAPFAAGTTPVRKRRRTWVAVAAALLAGIVVMAGVVYRIQTDNGEIVITPQSPDVEIVLLKGGKEVQIIDTKTNKRVTVPTGTYDVVVKNRPDGIEVRTNKIVVSRGQETLVILERVEKSRPAEETDKVGLVRTIRTKGLFVNAVAVSPNGRFIAASGGAFNDAGTWKYGTDLDVRLFERETGKEVRRFKGPTFSASSVAFSPDGKRLASVGSADQRAYVWDVDSGRLVHTLAGHKGVVTTVAFTPDGKRLLTMSWDKTIRLWDADSGKDVGQIGTAPEVATEWQSVAFLPGGKEAVVAGWGRLVVLDLETDKVVRTFPWPGGRVVRLSLSPDGKRLLTAGADGTDGRVRLWDVTTGKLMREFDNPHGAAIKTLNDPFQVVFQVAFLPDGRRFLSVGSTTVRLTDSETGNVLHTFEGHSDAVVAVALVPTGPYAVSGSLDQTVRLWRLPEALVGKTGWPRAFAPPQPTITRDGVSADQSGWRVDAQEARTVRLFEMPDPGVEDGVLTYRARMKSDKLQGKAYLEMWCRFPGKGEFFSRGLLNPVTGTTDWASYETPFFLKRGERPDLLKLNVVLEGKGTLWIKDVQVNFKANAPQAKSPSAAPSDQERLRGTWKAVQAEAFGKPVPAEIIAAFKPSLTFADESVTWKTNAAAPFAELIEKLGDGSPFPKEMASLLSRPVEGIYHLDPTKTPKAIDLIYLGQNRKVLLGIYRLEGDTLKLCVSIDPARADERPTEFATKAGVLRAIVVLKRQVPEKIGQVHLFEGHRDVIRSVAVSPDGRYLLSGGGGEYKEGKWLPEGTDFSLRLWDAQTGKELRQFEGHGMWVSSVAFSPDGRRALSGSWDRTVRLWDVETGKELRRFEGHADQVNSVAFSPDGRRALSGSLDRTLGLWDVETGKELRTFEGHADWVHTVAFSPDGRRALSGSGGLFSEGKWAAGRDHTLRLWDVETGKELQRLDGHTDWVEQAVFSPDGRLILSGSLDRTMRLWDVASGKEFRRFEGHTGGVMSVAFSPDGRRALSGGKDQTVRLWDVESGKERWRFEGHTGMVTSVGFSPDDRHAISAGADKTVRLWRLPDLPNR